LHLVGFFTVRLYYDTRIHKHQVIDVTCRQVMWKIS